MSYHEGAAVFAETRHQVSERGVDPLGEFSVGLAASPPGVGFRAQLSQPVGEPIEDVPPGHSIPLPHLQLAPGRIGDWFQTRHRCCRHGPPKIGGEDDVETTLGQPDTHSGRLIQPNLGEGSVAPTLPDVRRIGLCLGVAQEGDVGGHGGLRLGRVGSTTTSVPLPIPETTGEAVVIAIILGVIVGLYLVIRHTRRRREQLYWDSKKKMNERPPEPNDPTELPE